MMQEILKASDYKFEKIAKNYLDSISQKTNKNFITDKMPFNFKVIGIIKRCFPDAKIIHCYRNKNDNLLSIYKNFFNQDIMPWAYDAKELNLYYQAAKYLRDKLDPTGEIFSQSKSPIFGVIKRLDNIARGLLVTRLATAVRNYISQTARIGLDTIKNFTDYFLQQAVKPFADPIQFQKKI